MKSLLAALFLLVAAPLSAGWWPLWSTRSVEIPSGQTAVVQVRAYWTGLVDYGDGPPWAFKTDDDSIASGSLIVREKDTMYDFVITAQNPGTTAIHQLYSNGTSGSVAWVTIHVTCGDEPVPVAIDPVRHVTPGEMVLLGIATPAAFRTTFHWYAGEIGDTSQPLLVSGAEIAYIVKSGGPQNIWVSAVTACATTTFQFRLDTAPPKHRAAGK